MSKRGADRDLTKDNADEEDEMDQQESGTWRPANETKIKQREIVRVKRKTGDDGAPSTASAFPAFNFFGAPAATAPDASDNTTANAADDAVDKPAATEAATTAAADTTTQPSAPAPAPASAASKITSFAQLAAKQSADTWECATCDTRNKNTLAKCAACETPKPNNNKTTTTTTAAAEDNKPTGTITSAGFSFGTAVGFGVGSAAAPTFGSGGGWLKGFSSAASTGAADGSTAAGTTTSSSIPSFSFSTSAFSFPVSNSTAPSSFSDVAASSTTSSISSFTIPSTFTIPAGSTATPTPDNSLSEQFKDRKAESSGEESDVIVWKGETKVFVMKKVTLGGESKLVREEDDEDGGSTATFGSERKADDKSSSGGSGGSEEAKEEGKAGEVVDKWVDVGQGELHINRYTTETGQQRARLIMRAIKTHRLVLNVPLLASLASSFQLQSDKYVRLASVNVEEGGGKVVQYLLRVKGKAEAQQVLETLKTVTDAVKETETK